MQRSEWGYLGRPRGIVSRFETFSITTSRAKGTYDQCKIPGRTLHLDCPWALSVFFRAGRLVFLHAQMIRQTPLMSKLKVFWQTFIWAFCCVLATIKRKTHSPDINETSWETLSRHTMPLSLLLLLLLVLLILVLLL